MTEGQLDLHTNLIANLIWDEIHKRQLLGEVTRKLFNVVCEQVQLVARYIACGDLGAAALASGGNHRVVSALRDNCVPFPGGHEMARFINEH
jgi:hypothetical protein